MKLNIVEKYDKPFEYSEVFVSLFLAFQYFLLWLTPNKYSLEKLESYIVLMAFEFIMVHSGVFMSFFPKKITLYIFFPLYGLFALAFNIMVSDNSILILYSIAIFNRMRFAFIDVSLNIKTRNILYSVFSAITYFILVIFVAAVFVNSIPDLGLNEVFLKQSGYRLKKPISGSIFTDIPKVAICFGFIYYIFISVIKLVLIRKRYNKISLR